MESDKIGIGELARRSGLSVSALRFYDGAAVLAPSWVDDVTGYRYYRPEQVADARMVADLRRVGMAVADIRRVLAASDDRLLVDDILTTHLRRLEDGLADARRVLSAIRARLDAKETCMTPTKLVMKASTLNHALCAVRHAASVDPELPQLGGVLLDVDGDSRRCQLVATDRYRLIVFPVEVAEHDGSSRAVVIPMSVVDELVDRLSGHDSSVTVECSDDRIIMTSPDGQSVSGQCLDVDFPDYRRLVRSESPTQVRLDVERFRADLLAAPTQSMTRDNDDVAYSMVVLNLGRDGEIDLGPAATDKEQIGVNREFLLQALDELAAPELTLGLDGPISPLAIRNPDNPDVLAMLMPVRLT